MHFREVGGVRVALPPTSADVELESLKDADGNPVRIRCRRVPAELIAAAYETLPADGPEVGIQGQATDAQVATNVARVVSRSSAILEAGCLIVGPGGEDSPAFGPGLIPLTAISIGDAAQLLMTVSYMSGVGKAASERARFRYEYGEGLGDGGGAGRPVREVREDAELVPGPPGADGG